MMKTIRKTRNLHVEALGIYWDRIWEKDPKTGIVRLKEETKKRRNAITIGMTRMIAALLKGDSLLPGGILFHAVGTGDPSWDISLPLPSRTEEQLVSEVARLAPTDIDYIKIGFGQAESGTKSTIIDTVNRFEPDDFFNTQTVEITGGTNNGESRTISDYDQATGKITVSSDFTNPIDSTSVYEINSVIFGTVTNAIQIRTTFPAAAGPFNDDLREQGLFAGDATSTLNSGQMIDKINHAKITKTAGITLERFIQLVFQV